MNTSVISPAAQAFQLTAGFAVTRSVHALVQSGIADFLKEDAKTIDDIAVHCRTAPEMTFRFLRFLSRMGVVELIDRVCRLTAVGRLFRRDVPDNFTQSLEVILLDPWQTSWSFLLHSICTGEPAFPHIYGKSAWDYLAEHPEYGQPFNAYLRQLSQMNAQALVDSYDFSSVHTICDVGGGKGYLLKTILERYPSSTGILVDLPSVVAEADMGETASRCEVVAGSFFEFVPEADLIILKSVLHNWSDEKARVILENCTRSLKPGGRILAMDMVILEGGNPLSYFYDLHMFVLLGGRERTEKEFTRLFTTAGLRINAFIPTGGPQFLIEAEPV